MITAAAETAFQMRLEQIKALDAQYGRARMLEHAIASHDDWFKIAAAWTINLATTIKMMNEAERARQAGKANAKALRARVDKLLSAAREQCEQRN